MLFTFADMIGFPMGQDFLVPPDKGTKVPSLSWDKGTMGKAQNLAMERAGTES